MSEELSNLVVKDDEKRLVQGWASVEIVDRQGEIVPIDTIKEAFLDYVSNGGIVMKQHKNQPVGRVIQWNVEKNRGDIDGINMIVEINKSGVLADETWQEVKSSIISGFSIGGKTLEREERMNKSGDMVKVLKKIELNEVSLVREPANQLSVIENVSMAKSNAEKQAVDLSDDSNTITERKFEKPDESVNKEMMHDSIFKFLKASYPFDECLREQEKKYGSKETAQKICGSIRAKYGKSYDNEWSESDANSDKSDEEDEVDKSVDFIIMNKYYDPIQKTYMWDKCMKDQMDRYHDEGDAEQVCGAIRRKVMSRNNYSYTDHNASKGMDKANYYPTDSKQEANVKRIAENHVEQSDGDKVSTNPLDDGRKVKVNKGDNMGINMVSKGQLHDVGDKNMNEDVETESNGFESKVRGTKKGELSTKIEEEEHAREKPKFDTESKREEGEDEGREREEEKAGDMESHREERDERSAYTELAGKLDKIIELLSGRGKEEEFEESAKANYMDESKNVEQYEPKGSNDNRRKGGVGIEQVPSGIEKGNIKKFASEKPNSAVGFGRDYTSGNVSNEEPHTYEDMVKSVLKGAKTIELYNKSRGGR